MTRQQISVVRPLHLLNRIARGASERDRSVRVFSSKIVYILETTS